MTVLTEWTELDQALPTFAVLVRFLEVAPDRETARDQVTQRLSARGEPFEEVTAAPHAIDGRWVVTARFVVVSVEPHTAVAGVHDSLRRDGVSFQEVWADARCA
ncbi:MAG: hypothetical protein M3N21_00665 [Actinomycetota bacterium]|nr:hypothetical protein [Actinomycetota bacterium]